MRWSQPRHSGCELRRLHGRELWVHTRHLGWHARELLRHTGHIGWRHGEWWKSRHLWRHPRLHAREWERRHAHLAKAMLTVMHIRDIDRLLMDLEASAVRTNTLHMIALTTDGPAVTGLLWCFKVCLGILCLWRLWL